MLKKMFDLLDTVTINSIKKKDGDGVISINDILYIFSNKEISQEYVDIISKEINQEHNNHIDFNEFKEFMRKNS